MTGKGSGKIIVQGRHGRVHLLQVLKREAKADRVRHEFEASQYPQIYTNKLCLYRRQIL